MNVLSNSVIYSNHELQIMFGNLATLNYQGVLWIFIFILGLAIVLEYLHLGTEVIQNVTPMSSKVFAGVIWIAVLIAIMAFFLQVL